MIRAWWADHIAWRLRPASATASSPGRGGPPEGVFCGRCSRPREDLRFKMCFRCRTMTRFNQDERRKKLVRTGACPKCGGPRDDGNSVCSGCLAKERDRYQRRKAGPGRPAKPNNPQPEPGPRPTKLCKRCGGPRDNPSLPRCRACRAAATEYERRRIGRLQARADGNACVSCHLSNPDLTFKICPKCRSTRADASRRKRAEVKRAKMAPPH